MINLPTIYAETERLILRSWKPVDLQPFSKMNKDPQVMKYFPSTLTDVESEMFYYRIQYEFELKGWGLYAVELKESGEFIGDCGITIQNIDSEMLPEIGYHIHKKYWRNGFAKEAARAVIDWVFQNTQYDKIYSYMKYTNVGSYATAMANGMKKVKEYPDQKNGISYVYAIKREEWERLN